MQIREKVGKSRNTVFFQWFVAPESRKVGSLKRRVRSQLARWEMLKKCTPLWREAHFEVKMYKTHQVWTTFGSSDVEQVHAVVARSTFRSQNVQNTPGSDHFWKLRCRKSAGRCGAKQISKSKCTKHYMLGPLLDVQMSFCVAGARDCAPCQKWAKREGFVAFPKTMAGVGHLKRICKDAFSVASAVQETCSSELLGGPGADFLRGVAFWSIRSSGLLRWFCVTGAALRMTWHHFFVNHKTHWYVSSALTFPFLKDVSQNCFVSEIVNFKNWGSLAELFRFWRCQVQKLRNSLAELFRFWRCQVQKLRASRRIASVSGLQVDRQTDRQTNR